MKKTIAWLLCAAWMGVIYIMSAMPGDISGDQSGRIVRLLVRILQWLSGPDAAVNADLLALLVRKAAHMAEYAVLFLLYRRALSLSDVRHPGVIALMMSACYAATDEWHQGFVADRNPSPIDVCIDTLGAAAAWGLTAIIRKTKRSNR